jgi:hypothetical protein
MLFFFKQTHITTIPIAEPSQSTKYDATSNAIGYHIAQAKSDGRYQQESAANKGHKHSRYHRDVEWLCLCARYTVIAHRVKTDNA